MMKARTRKRIDEFVDASIEKERRAELAFLRARLSRIKWEVKSEEPAMLWSDVIADPRVRAAQDEYDKRSAS